MPKIRVNALKIPPRVPNFGNLKSSDVVEIWPKGDYVLVAPEFVYQKVDDLHIRKLHKFTPPAQIITKEANNNFFHSKKVYFIRGKREQNINSFIVKQCEDAYSNQNRNQFCIKDAIGNKITGRASRQGDYFIIFKWEDVIKYKIIFSTTHYQNISYKKLRIEKSMVYPYIPNKISKYKLSFGVKKH